MSRTKARMRVLRSRRRRLGKGRGGRRALLPQVELARHSGRSKSNSVESNTIDVRATVSSAMRLEYAGPNRLRLKLGSDEKEWRRMATSRGPKFHGIERAEASCRPCPLSLSPSRRHSIRAALAPATPLPPPLMQVACEDWTYEDIGAALRESGKRLLSRTLLDAVAALIEEHAPDWQDLRDAAANDDLLARKWLPPTADDSDKRVRLDLVACGVLRKVFFRCCSRI
jgi:hypothetical protein